MTAARTRPGRRSRRPSARSASACRAASPSAAPGAARPAAPARPTRPPCTAPTSRGPAPSQARHTFGRPGWDKARCACKADPPALHGPYIQWTRTLNGKTVTRRLAPAQYQAYAPWFGNTRRLRALTAELQALSLTEMARAEGWATINPGTQAPARTKLTRVPTAQTTQNAGRSARLTRDQPLRSEEHTSE